MDVEAQVAPKGVGDNGGTDPLGAEVFASDTEERIVYHTCKSRACPSCGQQATRVWQRDQCGSFPRSRMPTWR